jgi:nucleoside-diphosphate-sugar epimerase
MHILVTGADRPLGAATAAHLSLRHNVVPCGLSAVSGMPAAYHQVDLRSDAAVAPRLAGIDAIVHAAEFDPLPQPDLDLLEHASLGTYQLFCAARQAGVSRVVLLSSLSFFDAYPDSYLIDEMWRPWPSTSAPRLAPFLSETVAREFAHEGRPPCICLRLLPIGDDLDANTSLPDALEAVDRALALQFVEPGYRWQVYHVTRAPRFITRDARLLLGFGGAVDEGGR